MLENSPVGESRSNGLTEKAVQEVQGSIRTIKDCAEFNMSKLKPSDDHEYEMSGAS